MLDFPARETWAVDITVECSLSALMSLICWILQKLSSERFEKNHSMNSFCLNSVKSTMEILHVGEREA